MPDPILTVACKGENDNDANETLIAFLAFMVARLPARDNEATLALMNFSAFTDAALVVNDKVANEAEMFVGTA